MEIFIELLRSPFQLAILCLPIACYVLQALGMFFIAKRRQINHPWLGWIPVADNYLLGCISDQYQYVVKGRNTSRRKALLALNIILWAAYVVFMVILIGSVVRIIFSAMDMDSLNEMQLIQQVVEMFLGFFGLLIVMGGVAIALTIVRHVALYDLYSSCNPDNNVLFLVLGIFFPVTQPFFVFACRNKDLGMPPKRNEPVYQGPQSSENWNVQNEE